MLRLIVSLFVLAGLGAAQDGAVAPAGRWVIRGGAASRAGASHSRLPEGPVGVHWRATVGGTIAGEPLVWDDRIVCEVADAKGRWLAAFRVDDGKAAGKTRRFDTKASLAPSIWNRLVAVRVEPREIAVFRVERRKLSRRVWTIKADGDFGEPILFGREIYVRVGDEVRRYDFAVDEPAWRAKVAAASELAMWGGAVFTVAYDRDKQATIVAIDRKTGKTTTSSPVAYHGGRKPGEPARLCVGRDVVLAVHALPTEAQNGSKLQGAFVRLNRDGGTLSFGGAGLLDIRYAHDAFAHLGTRQLYRSCGSVQHAWLSCEGVGTGIVLADQKSHERLLADGFAPTFGRRTAMIGPVAFDIATLEIRWTAPVVPRGRMIPLRGAVLAVVGDGELVALRSSGDGGAFREPVAWERPAKATVVLDDGTRIEGTMRLTAESVERVVDDAVDGTWPIARVSLIESPDGGLCYHAADDDVLEEAGHWFDRALGIGYRSLLRTAIASNDPELIRGLMSDAAMLGEDEKHLKSAERKLRSLRRKALVIKKPIVEKVRAKREAVERDAIDAIWTRVAKTKEPQCRAALLRAVLVRMPDHAGAVAEVRKLLPDGIEPGESFSALDWLDFVEVIGQVPIDVIDAKRSDPKKTAEQRALVIARDQWRKDLVGIQSQRLFVITPLAKPGRIARTLSMGELVCDRLAKMFAGSGKRPGRRLVLFLAENKEEYLAISGDRKGTSPLQWSAGHYDEWNRLSRMFVPAGRDAFERMHQTFAHELTHQWIAEQCPAFDEQERVTQRGGIPGFWIVEGFASFVEGFDYDLEFRHVNDRNPRDEAIEALAAAFAMKDAPLIPWKTLLGASQAGMWRAVDPKPNKNVGIPMRWQLGGAIQPSGMNFFYWQAAAVCHYLYHGDDGKHRARLIRYVADHYTGKRTKLDIEVAFGCTPEELGARARAHVLAEAKRK